MNASFRFALPLLLLAGSVATAAPSNPVLFVTAPPSTSSAGGISGTFGHFVSFVSNHEGRASRAPRGGDLMIVYPNGTVRNLTEEAGYGTTPGQEICVREPNVHWSGTKAVFSMVVGGTGHSPSPAYFQLYEVTGLGIGETATITKLPQPEDYNHIQPCYGSDDSIIFASDMLPHGNRDHYPPLDEYESTSIVTGLWKMNADGTNLHILDHCPSGDFTPIVDSFGRVVFTRWDHLKRDQQADLTIDEMVRGLTPQRHPVTFASEESSTYHGLQFGDEYFPENGRLHPDIDGAFNPDGIPHPYWDQDFVPGMTKQDFNHFFPWMINQDGTDAEVLNHLGRHEFFGHVPKAWQHLPDFSRSGDVYVRSFNQMREHPTVPGRYYGVDAAEFGTHGAGKILYFDAPPSMNPDAIPATMKAVTPPNAAAWAGNVALTMFRDPMPMTDGSLWASVNGTMAEADDTAAHPPAPNPIPFSSNYQFIIRKLVPNGEGYLEPGEELVPGGIMDTITYPVSYHWPLRSVTYTGRMWELFPVEVVARPVPSAAQPHLPEIEKSIMEEELGGEEGIAAFTAWLKQNNLAVVTVRDNTVRGDKQQPYNLKVSWSGHETKEVGSTPDEISYLQFLSAQYVRAYASSAALTTLNAGRRPLPRFHEQPENPDAGPGAPVGTVRIADDGSAAAFVPAGRAMTWQLTDADGDAVVRERYWITFAAGEVRSCTNCHGVNTTDVHGGPIPTNPPQAFRSLLQHWKGNGLPATTSTSWMLY